MLFAEAIIEIIHSYYSSSSSNTSSSSSRRCGGNSRSYCCRHCRSFYSLELHGIMFCFVFQLRGKEKDEITGCVSRKVGKAVSTLLCRIELCVLVLVSEGMDNVNA